MYEDEAKTIRFLRDLRDKAVWSGGASSFIMGVFGIALDAKPEPEDEMKARHADLERNWLGKST